MKNKITDDGCGKETGEGEDVGEGVDVLVRRELRQDLQKWLFGNLRRSSGELNRTY